MAPAACREEVDQAAPAAWPARHRPRDQEPGPSFGQREPQVGLPSDPGRAPRPGHPPVGHIDRLDPSPSRAVSLRKGPTWAQFLRSQASGILACDFLTIETVFLKTYYVLFFIEVKTRSVHVAGATTNPDGAWVTQQARNVSADLREAGAGPRFLIHDRDTKFTASYDAVFEAEGAQIITTPIRAPNANAHAERWVGTVRAECLDWILVRGRRHLERVLREYVTHYNDHRPHQAMGLHPPVDRGGGSYLDARHQNAIWSRPILGD
jgi:putative transposase